MFRKKEDVKDLLSKKRVVCLGALICCALWGSAYPSIKIGYELFKIGASDTAAQIYFAGLRFTLAGILAVLIGSVLSGKVLYPSVEAIPKVFVLSLLQTVLQYLFFYVGLANTSGVKAAIIGAVNVFVAIFVASVIFHQELLTRRKIIGCLIGFAGVVLINLNGLNFQMSIQGEGFIFFSTVAYAFSSVLLKRLSVKYNPVMLSGYQFIVGGLVMIAVGKSMGGALTVVTGKGIGLLAYLGLLSAIAYSLWGILLKYNPVSEVAVFGFMNPVFGVMLSAMLLGEADQAAGIMSMISLVMVCIGIYIVNYQHTPQRHHIQSGEQH